MAKRAIVSGRYAELALVPVEQQQKEGVIEAVGAGAVVAGATLTEL
jgi:hypothetical protein